MNGWNYDEQNGNMKTFPEEEGVPYTVTTVSE